MHTVTIGPAQAVFTTAVDGDYGRSENAGNRQLLAQSIGIPVEWVTQVHGNHVRTVGWQIEPVAAFSPRGIPAAELTEPRSGAGGSEASQDVPADAQIWVGDPAQRPALGIITADCGPILLASAAGDALGAIHAGWRGLAAGIVEQTITTLAERNILPSNLTAAVGPLICRYCYQVGPEVLVALDRYGANVKDSHADLRHGITCALQMSGVRNIIHLNHCTYEDHQYHSHRRDGTLARQASIIY